MKKLTNCSERNCRYSRRGPDILLFVIALLLILLCVLWDYIPPSWIRIVILACGGAVPGLVFLWRQQQRVAIARALASKPSIILADEPTGNLDSKTSDDVIGLLKMTSREFHQTIVMITHNPAIAQMADRIVRIEDGRIVA